MSKLQRRLEKGSFTVVIFSLISLSIYWEMLVDIVSYMYVESLNIFFFVSSMGCLCRL